MPTDSVFLCNCVDILRVHAHEVSTVWRLGSFSSDVIPGRVRRKSSTFSFVLAAATAQDLELSPEIKYGGEEPIVWASMFDGIPR